MRCPRNSLVTWCEHGHVITQRLELMYGVIGYRACHAIACEVTVVINKNFTMAKYIYIIKVFTH